MKIHFSNFPQNWDEKKIQAEFEKSGKVTGFHLKRDKMTKKSLGFGTLEMSDADAGKAISALHDKTYEEKKISVIDAVTAEEKINKSNSLSGKSGTGNSMSGSKGVMGGGPSGLMRRNGSRGS